MTQQPALVVDAPITRRTVLGDYVYIHLECPKLAGRAVAGQFVNVACEGALLRRPFSIYHPYENAAGDRAGIALLFKVIGRGTRYMASREVGQTLSLLGPLGHGLEDPSLLGPRVLLAGGGYGIAPLDFCAHVLRDAGHEVTLVQGTNALSLLPLYDGDLEGWPIARRFTEIGVPVHVASLGGERGAFAGTVVDLMERHLEGDPQILACGSHPMMRAVAQCAERHGLRCYVLMEEQMGCGVSVCRSCVCQIREQGPDGAERIVNRTACTDGPLMDAGPIVWKP